MTGYIYIWGQRMQGRGRGGGRDGKLLTWRRWGPGGAAESTTCLLIHIYMTCLFDNNKKRPGVGGKHPGRERVVKINKYISQLGLVL